MPVRTSALVVDPAELCFRRVSVCVISVTFCRRTRRRLVFRHWMAVFRPGDASAVPGSSHTIRVPFGNDHSSHTSSALRFATRSNGGAVEKTNALLDTTGYLQVWCRRCRSFDIVEGTFPWDVSIVTSLKSWLSKRYAAGSKAGETTKLCEKIFLHLT